MLLLIRLMVTHSYIYTIYGQAKKGSGEYGYDNAEKTDVSTQQQLPIEDTKM